MATKSEAEVVLEICQSVEQSNEKQKRLKSSTFWRLFGVKSRQKKVVDRINQLLEEQGLKVSVKSEASLGEEKDDDWIILTLRLRPQPPPPPPIPSARKPSPEWFEMIQTRSFESEREVETYFITPLLENLGYEYSDIVMGYPVRMFRGVQKTTTEADFVVFRGPDRDQKDVLLVIEAKKSNKGISIENISQAKSYAHELLPACYIVTNGQEIKVYQFNGMLAPDDCVMDFDRLELKEKWQELYGYVSKEAVQKRKEWLSNKLA
jgi:hypothetical protein